MKLALFILASRLAIAGCVVVDHDQITAADLARAFPQLSAIPGDTKFGFSPLPGARRNLLAGDIETFGRRYQVMLAATPVCVEYSTHELSPDDLGPAISRGLNPSVQVKIVDYSRVAVPAGEVTFARNLMFPTSTPGIFLCRGFVVYGNNRKLPIWARAQFSDNGSVVKSLEPPNLEVIHAGDQIDLEVRNGAAVLRLSAKAVSPARQGQVVRLRNDDTGKTFLALAVAERSALVDLTKGVRK